jgi:CDP-diacylglycerol---glycerol-3-phosphate 3-phosphatidyltransferase
MSEKVSEVIRFVARYPGALLVRTGISPNAVTLIGGGLTVAVAVWIATGAPAPLVAGLAILVTAFFDALDGAVARISGRSSPFGGFLDSVMDRVADAAILIGLLVHFLQRGDERVVLGIALALAAFPLVSYARALAERLGVEGRGGLMNRPVRILVLGISLCVGLFTPAIFVLAVGALATAIYRVVVVARALGGSGPTGGRAPDPAPRG